MGLLGRSFAAVLVCSLAACYAPDVRDCTVKCTSADDCAGNQSCNADGYCVSASETRCMSTPGAPGTVNDAGVPVIIDAANVLPADAAIDAPPDAPTQGFITFKVEGKGFVQLEGIGTCAATCEYTLPLSVSVTMHAYPGEDFRFDKWTTPVCTDEHDPSCSFVPALTLELGAKFRKDN